MFRRRKRKALFLGPEEPGRSQRPALEELSTNPGPGLLVGSSWIAQVEAVASQGSTPGISSWGEASPRVQPPGEPAAEGEGEEEAPSRRRRAVRGGLVEQLERALEWGRSGEALRRHVPGQGGPGRELAVRSVGLVGDSVLVRGQAEALLVHRQYCPVLPVPGQRVTYWPPYSRMAAHGSTSLALGLTGLRLGAVEKVSAAEEEPLAGPTSPCSVPASRAAPAPP